MNRATYTAMVRVRVLGSNGTFATPAGPSAGYLIDDGDTTIWVDAGFGTFAALQRVVDYRSLAAVIITHRHADHSADLFGFYHAIKHGAEPLVGFPIYSPAGFREAFTDYLGGAGHEPEPTLRFIAVEDDSEHSIGSIEMRFAATDHPVPTVAIRFEADGRTLAYSSDTGPRGTWPSIAERADVFLCEATYQGATENKPFTQHLTAGEAGRIAREQTVDRLVITHIWPMLDPGRSLKEAERSFGKPVGLASVGMVVEV